MTPKSTTKLKFMNSMYEKNIKRIIIYIGGAKVNEAEVLNQDVKHG